MHSIRRGTIWMTLLLTAVLASPLSAQWTTTGNDIRSTNSGNVGIGTSTPSAKLTVNGDVLVTGRISGSAMLSLGTQGGGSQFIVGLQNELANWEARGGTITTNTTSGTSIDTIGQVVNPGCSGSCSSSINYTNGGGSVVYEFTGLGVFDAMSMRGWGAYLQLRAGAPPSTIAVELLNSSGTWVEIWREVAPIFRNNLWFTGIALNPFGDDTDPSGVRYTLDYAYAGAGVSRIRQIGFYHQNRALGTYTFPFLHAPNVFTGQNKFAAPSQPLEVSVSASSTATPALRLSTAGTAPLGSGAAIEFAGLNSGTNTILPYALITGAATNTGLNSHAGDLSVRTASSGSLVERVRITSSGRVGIGVASPAEALDVVGNIKVSGNINAKFQDLAEWVPARSPLDPGTVVILDERHSNHVKASNAPYDSMVAGVVSAQPGVLLGEETEGAEKIATTGRVRVRVTTANGAIRIGDLLVSSEVPGHAMKSKPVVFSGISLHRPGTILGKALEPLDSGTGEILVLLSLQ